ncbi:MAG: sigma 54-interacting transcriptional regulator [Deltaproteobacteria bacterium]|jgi:PAS domain S-box-containing protein|nr:sigma 54-interacting transcriptional regulator [Deltaproteobacteria bacterium]
MLQATNALFSFSLIAPYGNLATLFTKVAAGMPCIYSIHENLTLDEASAAARQVVKDEHPEVLLSRGGTADYIRSSVNVPVVDILTTGVDLLRALQPFVGKIRRIAFFHYKNMLPEVDTVAVILGITIDQYTFLNREELFSRMVEAKAKGAELGFGGRLVAYMREICEIDGILVEVGEDAVQRALNEAFSIARIRRAELFRRARMLTIINSIAEGIIATDETNALTLINPTAERLLGVNADEVLGIDAREIVPNTRTAKVLESGVPELNDIQDMGGTTIVTSRVPIILDGKTVGVVCTFSEADRIRQAEQRLRGKFSRKGFQAKYALEDIITGDSAMRSIIELAHMYAGTDATVLLQGESGTGKELFAQGIHLASHRAEKNFVPVNCAAIPEALLESELFGYVEGAFTGAKRQGKVGYFELAHEGTLFLDEISELPYPVQARLLRVLQEMEIVRVGGVQVIPVDVRVICATNHSLSAQMAMNRFRRDLYYRLNVLPLTIPPLRERKEDIPRLTAYFLREGLPPDFPAADISAIEQDIRPFLRKHSWPGNVRELRNIIERLTLAITMFPKTPWRELLLRTWQAEGTAAMPGYGFACASGSLKNMTRHFEQKMIRRLLDQYNSNHAQVAKLLGISRMSLWRKLRGNGDEAPDDAFTDLP